MIVSKPQLYFKLLNNNPLLCPSTEIALSALSPATIWPSLIQEGSRIKWLGSFQWQKG